MLRIWKLQRPLFSTEEIPSVMAYTKNKKYTAMVPMSDEQMDDLFGEELKIYIKGSVKNGVIIVKHRVEDQDW